MELAILDAIKGRSKDALASLKQRTMEMLLFEDVRERGALFFPFMDTLLNRMNEGPGKGATFLWDALLALAALHELRIVHGDVRPANFFVFTNGAEYIVKIGNFERAADLLEQNDPPTYPMVESDTFKFDYSWAPPEVLLLKRIPKLTYRAWQADVFSFGLMVRVAIDTKKAHRDLVTKGGRTPFLNVDSKKDGSVVVFSKILQDPFEVMLEQLVAGALKSVLFSHMLQINPDKRKSCNEILLAIHASKEEEDPVLSAVQKLSKKVDREARAGDIKHKELLDKFAEQRKFFTREYNLLRSTLGTLVRDLALNKTDLGMQLASTSRDTVKKVKNFVQKLQDGLIGQSLALRGEMDKKLNKIFDQEVETNWQLCCLSASVRGLEDEVHSLGVDMGVIHQQIVEGNQTLKALIQDKFSKLSTDVASKADLACHYKLFQDIQKDVQKQSENIGDPAATEVEMIKLHNVVLQRLQQLETVMGTSSKATVKAVSTQLEAVSLDLTDFKYSMGKELTDLGEQLGTVLQNTEFLRSALEVVRNDMETVLVTHITEMARENAVYKIQLFEAVKLIDKNSDKSMEALLAELKKIKVENGSAHEVLLKEMQDNIDILKSKSASGKTEIIDAVTRNATDILVKLVVISTDVGDANSNLIKIMKTNEQHSTALQRIILKTNVNTPRLLLALPAVRRKGIVSFMSSLVSDQIRLFFVCPVTLKVAQSGEHKIGYPLSIPKITLLKIAPVLIYSYYFLQFVLSNAPQVGVSLPDLPEDLNLNNLEYLNTLSKSLVEDMKKTSGLSPEEIVELQHFETAGNAVADCCKGKATTAVLEPNEQLLKAMEHSYQEIFSLMITKLEPHSYPGTDVQQAAQEHYAGFCPKYTGLVRAYNKENSTVEWVHASAVTLYEEQGEKCLYKNVSEG